MLEYLPWANKTHDLCLKKYKSGKFSCLDIELGGECNYHCAYCDSPDRKKTCSIDIIELERLIEVGQFDWVYVCGLGEPTFNGNYSKLISILQLCKKYNLRCSTFSNLSIFNKEIIEFIEAGVLHILFKYDSNNVGMVRALYGMHNVKEQLSNIKKAMHYVRVQSGMTNFAASIVPTQLNRDCILPIVEECVNAGVFPLLGELEASGKGQTNYENLWLNKEELTQIKASIDHMLGYEYTIPICPAVISGIHFSHDSHITVDSFTGLSCHWFWLKEPETKTLMRFNSSILLESIESTILNYRDACLPFVNNYFKSNDNVGLAFGGCGGNIQSIFVQYLSNHRGG